MTKPDALPDPREQPFLTAAEAAPLLGVSR